jgi:hypothetical protein
MFKQKGFADIELIVVAIVLLGAGGWIANIVKIIGTDFADFNGMLIARCIGVFIAPLGSVLGFF